MTQRLSKNFSRHEFTCQCDYGCGKSTIDSLVLDVLQDLVDHFQKTLPHYDVRCKVTSGHRCKRHNLNIGGSTKSKHLDGRAADFYLYDRNTGVRIDGNTVWSYLILKYPHTFGLGRYNNNRFHMDSREEMIRWDERTEG